MPLEAVQNLPLRAISLSAVMSQNSGETCRGKRRTCAADQRRTEASARRLTMKSDDPSSNINRRAVVASLGLLPALSGTLLSTLAQAQTAPEIALASWNDSPAKQAILDFVRA